MTRRLPLLPTLIVAAAVLTMIALGVWQLQRKEWKEGLIARYQAAQAMSAQIPWSGDHDEAERLLYRYIRVNCRSVFAEHPVAGTSAQGQSGWAQVQRCNAPSGEPLLYVGWSKEPDVGPVSSLPPGAVRRTNGQIVSGILAPGPRVVVVPPWPRLQPLAAPDPQDLPNNHLSYAVQWFFFAATALVIYVLALRKRWRS